MGATDEPERAALTVPLERNGESSTGRARLAVAHARPQEAQDRSERLLLNILPGPIAERLKHSNDEIADGYSEVTVMFADIVNFTQIAEHMTPAQVFALLNRMFSEFDTIAEQHGLEKIKTIGDAYMVAGGLNDGDAEFSASIAELALDMRDVVARGYVVESTCDVLVVFTNRAWVPRSSLAPFHVSTCHA